MKCDEVRPLQGPYLDSELDAKTTLEIEQHLKSCSECASFFIEEQGLQDCLKVALNRGERSASLWHQVEHAVLRVKTNERVGTSSPVPQPGGWQSLISTLSREMRAGWNRAPRVWSGLGLAWVVILSLNVATPESDTTAAARQQAPSASEMHFALKQKQVLMVDLAFGAERSPAGNTKAAPPAPRSDRRENTLNG